MASEKELFVTKQYVPVGQPLSQNDHTIVYKVKCLAEKGTPDGILKMYRHRNISKLYARLRQLDYSEWPHIYNVKYFDESTLIVEEFLEGFTLAELIAENRAKGTGMPEEQAYRIMDRLSACIAGLLQLDPPVIHYDLRPSNIFVTRSGAVKLLDFVPEHKDKKKFSLHSLLNTLGSIFHEMLTNKQPKNGKCIYRGRYTPVIATCLENDPDKQYQSIDEMKGGLRDAKENGSDFSDDAVPIPYWLTIPFQGTILSFEWLLFCFFNDRGHSSPTAMLFLIVLCLHALIYAFYRHQFLKQRSVQLGALRTALPIAALAAVFAVLYVMCHLFLA